MQKRSLDIKADKNCIQQKWRPSHESPVTDLLNTIKSLFTYRKMIRRKDMIKILFIGVCICHVCPAHPCGDNPMRFVNTFASSKGIDSASMLHFMRLNTPTDYSALMKEYRRYLECTQMVHNGYFKRSIDHELRRPKVLPSPFMEAALLNIRPRLAETTLKLLNLNENRDSNMDYKFRKSTRDSLNIPEQREYTESIPEYSASSSDLTSLLKRHLENLPDDDWQNRRTLQPGWEIMETIKRKR